jgi:hypothetical protein
MMMTDHNVSLPLSAVLPGRAYAKLLELALGVIDLDEPPEQHRLMMRFV